MKSLFNMGFASQGVFANQVAVRRPVLGQDTIDLDKLRSDLSLAEDKLAAINQWMANRPDYQSILGLDLDRWNRLTAQADSGANDATIVQQRISSDEPSVWKITPTERTNVYNWIVAMDQLYQLTMAHPQLKAGAGAPAAPGTPAAKIPGPQASSGPSPLVIGVGAAAAVGLLAVLIK